MLAPGVQIAKEQVKNSKYKIPSDGTPLTALKNVTTKGITTIVKIKLLATLVITAVKTKTPTIKTHGENLTIGAKSTFKAAAIPVSGAVI